MRLVHTFPNWIDEECVVVNCAETVEEVCEALAPAAELQDGDGDTHALIQAATTATAAPAPLGAALPCSPLPSCSPYAGVTFQRASPAPSRAPLAAEAAVPAEMEVHMQEASVVGDGEVPGEEEAVDPDLCRICHKDAGKKVCDDCLRLDARVTHDA